MELDDVKRLIEELRGRFDSPFSSEDKETIERLYASVCGKVFKPTSCQRCYHDAFIEIVCYIKRNGKMAEKSNFRLKAGAIIHSPLFEDGKVFTNENMTDEVAMRYLAKYPGQVGLFQAMPKDFKPGDLPKGDEPTLEEAQAMLKKAEAVLNGAKTKVVNIKGNIAKANDESKKAKAEKALVNAEKAVEKAQKGYDECKALVEELSEKSDGE